MQNILKRLDPGLLAALLLTLPIAAPFLTGRLPDTADAMLHLHRLVSAGISLENGIWYPRWAAHLHAGFGYPLHNFYTPFWHVIAGGLLVLFDGNPVHLWLGAQTAGVILCGPGAYLFARTFASRPAALVAAAAYTYAPIRFREIWAQGNVSQLIAMAFIAWGFWGLARLVQRPTPGRAALAALLIAALILTHHPTAFYFMPAAGLYVVMAGWLAGETRADKFRRIGIGVAAYGLGLLIATTYWLPAATEVEYTQLDNSISAAFDVRTHFKPLTELLGTTPLLDRTAFNPYRPLNVGFVQWILSLLGLVALILRWQRFTGWQRGHGLIAALAFPLTLFLMTAPSVWLWENIPLAERLSFPWRLLGLAALLVIPGAALWVDALPARWRQGAAISAIVLIVVSLLPAAYPAGGYFLRFEGQVTAADAQRYERIGVLGMTGENEYLPRWTDFQTRPAAQPDYSLYENRDWFFELWWPSLPESATFTQQDGEHPTGQRFDLTTPQSFDLQIRQMYFPGWKAELDGQPLEVFPSGAQGLATMTIPAGTHQLEVWYGGTADQHRAETASLIGLVICTGLFGWDILRRRKPVLVAPLSTHDKRFIAVVAGLSLGWLVLNQAYLIPHTEVFRPRSDLTAPYTMQTAYTDQFFEPGIGYRLELLGYTLNQSELQGGDQLTIDLYWRALQPFETNAQVNLALMSRDQTALYTQTTTYNIGGVGPSTWKPDQYVIQTIALDLSEDIPPTMGQLRLRVFSGENAWVNREGGESSVIGEVRLNGEGWDRLPAAAEEVETVFNGQIALRGLERAVNGDSLTLTLYWEALSDVGRDTTLLLHYQSAGEIVQQADQPPLGINYRTGEWREGDKLISRLVIPYPPEADSLLIGLYDSETILRWAASGGRLPLQDNAVRLSLTE